MRINQPVTDHEVTFAEGEFIVSITDTKGRITYVNKTFLDISGFTRQELIGKAHNIIRHPDMPAAAFQNLWDTVKADKPWSGIVKNRCKNGNFYWVQANVTPIREGNHVVGHLSVRTSPSKVEISAAETLYRNIRAGTASLEPSPFSKYQSRLKRVSVKVYLKLNVVVGIALMTGIASLAASGASAVTLAAMLTAAALLQLGLSQLLGRYATAPVNEAIKTLRQIAEGHFSDWITTDREDELGVLLQNLASTQIRLGNNVNKSQQRKWEMNRIRQALDRVVSSVMITDTNFDIIYMNESVTTMMLEAEADIRQGLPDFSANQLIDENIDAFDETPGRLREILTDLSTTLEAQISVGSRVFRIIATPILDDNSQRIGAVVEWDANEANVEEEIQAVIDGALIGDLSHRIPLLGKTGFHQRLSAGINQLVEVNEQIITESSSVMTAMAGGDLTQKVHSDYPGIFANLKNDINATAEKFTEVIASISRDSDEMVNSAQEIAQGNIDLSQRTEEQAASLEQTASSMEQLTSTVTQNADNANRADQLSSEARDRAEKGGEVVRKAITAMDEITASSNKIAAIIEVINNIAFQTNLLALNAAVEAARAGEQGRGFAVVASEVRNLAQRSASASRKIKELIEDSVAKVSEGSDLVNSSGETLGEITTSVKKVSDIIAEIATASQEQSSGIGQINKAITQMDGMTQQNAALVEQAAAASQSVGDQADGLNKLVSFFTTDRQHTQAVRTPQKMIDRRSADRPWQTVADLNPISNGPTGNSVLIDRVVAIGSDNEWEEF